MLHLNQANISGRTNIHRSPTQVGACSASSMRLCIAVKPVFSSTLSGSTELALYESSNQSFLFFFTLELAICTSDMTTYLPNQIQSSFIREFSSSSILVLFFLLNQLQNFWPVASTCKPTSSTSHLISRTYSFNSLIM